MTTPTIEKILVLPHSPQKVWDYLTQADHLAKWFHRPEADLANDSAFSMPGEDGDPLCWGEVQEMSAPDRLVYSFTARPMNGLMTLVTWELEPLETGTRVRLLHTGVPAGAEAFGLLVAFDKGWDGHLARMRDDLG